jgi:hypothetical protein
MKKLNYTVIGLVISLILVLGANVAILVRYRMDVSDYETRIANLEAEVNRQRSDKDTIRNLWEEQAAASDRLIIAQENLLNRIDDYKVEVRRSVRFVNSVPELLDTISEERLRGVEDSIDLEIENVNEKTEINAELKIDSKQTIDTLYLNAGEEQDNRANPRNDSNN